MRAIVCALILLVTALLGFAQQPRTDNVPPWQPAPVNPLPSPLKLPEELARLVKDVETLPATIEKACFYGFLWGGGVTAAILLLIYHQIQKEKEALKPKV